MQAQQSPAERVAEIQAALRAAKLDGWLFYDFRHSDPLAYRILKLDEKMFAFNAPAFRLEMRVNGRNSGAQRFVAGDENNIGIVRGDRFGVINRGECAAQRVIFDQAS